MMRGFDAYDAVMRTTVNIDEHLLREAKQLAARSGRSLGDVLDDALRALLLRPQHRGEGDAVTIPTFGGSGLRPGVDLEDKESLAALLDEPAGDLAAG